MKNKQRLFIIIFIMVSIGCLLLYFSKRVEDVARIEPNHRQEIADKETVKYETVSSMPPEIPEELLFRPTQISDEDNEIKFLIERIAGDDWDAANEAANKIVSLGKAALPKLVESLEGASVSLKGQLVFILGRIGDKDAAPALIEALDDENAYIRRNAVEALGKIKDEDAIYELTNSLFDDDVSVRERSAWALGELDDLRAAEDLIGRLSEEREEKVKLSIVYALGKLKDDGAIQSLLTELMSNSNHIYKNEVVMALGEIGDFMALPGLVEYLDRLKQYKPKERLVIFQWEESIRIAEEVIQKIRRRR